MTKPNKTELPGRTFVNEDTGSQVRVLDADVPQSTALPIGVLYEQPGIVAWVGRRDEMNRIYDALPVFTAGANNNGLSPLTIGLVLLTDLARDTALENRYASNNFTILNATAVEEDVEVTFGKTTRFYLEREYVKRKLGTENARFLAKRLWRTLKANYPGLSKVAELDKARIVFKSPHGILTTVDASQRYANLAEMAADLGAIWYQAVSCLVTRHPELMSRDRYFKDVPDEPASPSEET